jgi:cell division septation protein DedD
MSDSAQTNIASLRPKQDLATQSNQKVDMFSAQGFALANRIATAFASSDAVPTQYRTHITKRVNGQDQYVENQSALGNCIVAIEVAQAVGMSISSVMQNSDVIEGKVRWSDKFVVAGVNASRRFSPLRFEVQNLGPIKASYKEKGGWNNEKKRFDMIERTVETDNYHCIAWALPYGIAAPANIHTLKQAKDAGLPVVEGPPISMELAIEEGWYGKAGSKWQTQLKHKMLMMRAGRYFGDVHAADITMGIGKTTEEEFDVVDLYADGSVASVTTESLRTAPREVVVEPSQATAKAEKPIAQEKVSAKAEQPAKQQSADSSWEPTEQEKAEIQAREIAEAQGQGQEPSQQPRVRRERTNVSME